jgi:Fe-Mn family superoxide dismutase
MAFNLPSLPFEYTSLEPHIDALTMNIHHTKHHQTYVNNLNAALDKFPEFRDLGLVAINQAVGSDKVPSEVATAVRNNGGGHWNHRCGPDRGITIRPRARSARGGCRAAGRATSP